jgi:dihydroneopterin aldolase
MPGTITIELKRLRFFAYHGLYASERKAGNEFEVDLEVAFQPASSMILTVDETIDYARLYDIVAARMKEPEDLLETVAMRIAELVHTAFPRITHIDITVRKLHPPIEKLEGHTAVRYQAEY